jgi:hypothetical protein
MARKIVTINDLEFLDTSQEGNIHFYNSPEFDPYNKHFKASVAYLPLDDRCFKIIKWCFSENSEYKDDRFPQYDIFEMGAENFNTFPEQTLDMGPKHAIDLSESDFKQWLLREQLPII